MGAVAILGNSKTRVVLLKILLRSPPSTSTSLTLCNPDASNIFGMAPPALAAGSESSDDGPSLKHRTRRHRAWASTDAGRLPHEATTLLFSDDFLCTIFRFTASRFDCIRAGSGSTCLPFFKKINKIYFNGSFLIHVEDVRLIFFFI